jgi:hypothetical protein
VGLPFGVGRQSKSDRFQAQVRINGKLKHFGTHDTIEEAHEAAMTAAQERYS